MKGQLIRTAFMLAVGLLVSLTVSLRAQVQTQTSSTSGAATKEISVEKGSVVSVNGNDLVVKMDNGEIRHFPNVPESARATVNGQQLGIHDLKPGMTLQRTITTTTTPRIITTTQTVTGTVWQVMPPRSVILTLEDGTNQQFKIPEKQKFNVDGQMVDAFGLRKGMKINATKVTEVPETVVNVKKVTTGQLPPPPPPAADVPILVVVAAPVPAPAAAPAPAETAEAAPAKLPKTGSVLPLVGLAGALMLSLGFGLRALHRKL
jgi:LPXTG-motif cell wall-anchored protein